MRDQPCIEGYVCHGGFGYSGSGHNSSQLQVSFHDIYDMLNAFRLGELFLDIIGNEF